ncbi:MAG: aspartate-semialdehyde dehydrogenase [Planctomycetota bacterium]|jgi:aspartate-semialdehyde dehydrogenase
MSVNVAVVGATGAVGQTMRDVLEERDFPVREIAFLASERSVGKTMTFRGDEVAVEELKEDSFKGIDIALFSIPKAMSRRFSPVAAKAGAVVVDNSNAFRMDPEVPLVVPEVNAHAIAGHKGIIANPNCSTIQMVVALKPLHDAASITRVIVTTFQSVSGTGLNAMDELESLSRARLDGKALEPKVYPFPIAFNCLPEIPNRKAWDSKGYTEEEMKMHHETRKIMEADINVAATCVRVPVFIGHSEAVTVETEKKLSADEARRLLAAAPGVRVVDDPAGGVYPTALDCAGIDDTLVGRIREDYTVERGLNMWVVSDNLRKGAATNAVQIAEHLPGGR